jgi:hypothetical protein
MVGLEFFFFFGFSRPLILLEWLSGGSSFGRLGRLGTLGDVFRE